MGWGELSLCHSWGSRQGWGKIEATSEGGDAKRARHKRVEVRRVAGRVERRVVFAVGPGSQSISSSETICQGLRQQGKQTLQLHRRLKQHLLRTTCHFSSIFSWHRSWKGLEGSQDHHRYGKHFSPSSQNIVCSSWGEEWVQHFTCLFEAVLTLMHRMVTELQNP